MAPKIQFLLVIVAIFDYMICPVASVVYVLRMLWVCEPNDNRQDLIAAFRRPWPRDVQSFDIARVDGLDDLPPSMEVLCPDRLDDLRHGGVRKVSVCAEKEVEYLLVGAEKGGAAFIDEIAVRGNTLLSFLFGEGLRFAGVAAVGGNGGGVGVGRLERGAFGVALTGCAEEAQHLRLKFQKLLLPFPRRNLANLANDGVVLLRKCCEQEFALAFLIV